MIESAARQRQRRTGSAPFDRSLPYLCEIHTPLYHTDVYSELTPEQRRRYNQITGVHFNEVICFFERTVAENALGALLNQKPGTLPEALVEAIARFLDEERAHTRMFRALNRIAEPEWYAGRDEYILGSKRAGRWLFGLLTRRPWAFPASVLLMLVMEEKSLEMSRRMIREGEGRIEPHFLETYRSHLEDEAGHVRIDGRLLAHLFENRARFVRKANASLFGFLLTRFFLAPDRSTLRVVELLAKEHPDVAPLLPRMRRELGGLARDPRYHAMMFSREACPLAFDLFDRFSEFSGLEKGLLSYVPDRRERGR